MSPDNPFRNVQFAPLTAIPLPAPTPYISPWRRDLRLALDVAIVDHALETARIAADYAENDSNADEYIGALRYRDSLYEARIDAAYRVYRARRAIGQ